MTVLVPALATDGRDRLGPGETLLLEAADSRFAYHGSSADKVGKKLLAQAREKVPEPEIGTGGELLQQRGASSYLYNTLDYPDFIAADASAQRMHLAKDAGALALGVDTADTIQAAEQRRTDARSPARGGARGGDEAHGPNDEHDDASRQSDQNGRRCKSSRYAPRRRRLPSHDGVSAGLGDAGSPAGRWQANHHRPARPGERGRASGGRW